MWLDIINVILAAIYIVVLGIVAIVAIFVFLIWLDYMLNEKKLREKFAFSSNIIQVNVEYLVTQ